MALHVTSNDRLQPDLYIMRIAFRLVSGESAKRVMNTFTWRVCQATSNSPSVFPANHPQQMKPQELTAVA